MTPGALAHLHARVFTTPRPWTEAEFAGLLAQPSTFLLHEPGGFLLARVIADEAELLTLATDPAQRRQGIARRLVAGFVAKAATLGATSAFLEVAEDNTPARALYTQTGFAEVGRRRRYFTTPEGRSIDALILRRALAE